MEPRLVEEPSRTSSGWGCPRPQGAADKHTPEGTSEQHLRCCPGVTQSTSAREVVRLPCPEQSACQLAHQVNNNQTCLPKLQHICAAAVVALHLVCDKGAIVAVMLH